MDRNTRTGIDLVIPMVFPADPQWQKAYQTSHSGGCGVVRHVRYRSWGTEHLLLQCVCRYMPWLRKVHILLASESQKQDWMRKTWSNGPELHIVYHRDFVPGSHLPLFNVNIIEMFLHCIPDLSEEFIYSNDDFFPLSPLLPTDFFRDGLPCQHHNEKPYPSHPNCFQRFVMNGLNMVAADFGKRYTNTWLRGGHSMQPMLRSTVETVCRLHADRISKSFTVSRSDKNFNQYIFPFYQHLSGRYIDYTPRRQYVGPGTPTSHIASILADPDAGIVCINDNESIVDWERRAAVVRREIELRVQNQSEIEIQNW